MKESNTHGKPSSVAERMMLSLMENAPTYLKIMLPILQGYLLYRLFWLVSMKRLYIFFFRYCFHLVDLTIHCCFPGQRVGC